MTGPLVFTPLYMDRVWGGRALASLYGRTLPDASTPIGESWELVDREREQSVVRDGPYEGRTLHELWLQHRDDIFGPAAKRHAGERFPLLMKILDARDDLSIQVHPPAAIAPSLGGEPKTEMWFIAHAEPGAALHVGVKPGVDRTAFERALADGTVEEVVHKLPVVAGDAIFIPSGRLHAIGAGLVIFEIQQNSDTTYRVFDWNRTGLDGKPRALHVAESLACIDFTDTAPALTPAGAEVLAECPYFRVQRVEMAPRSTWTPAGFVIAAVVQGLVTCGGRRFGPGEFFLVPESGAAACAVTAETGSTLLHITLP